MSNKFSEILGYIVVDNKYNREWYPSLVGRGFAAPPGYAAVLPYRKIVTEGFSAPEGYTPPQPIDSVMKENS